MNPGFSLYLDLMRLLAALLVLVYHSNNRMLVEQVLPFSAHGHAAVMVFFVLSGYVIAYVAAERERTPAAFWASRLSRFYVLTVPVVLLTPLLDAIGEVHWPSLYEGVTTHDLAALRIASSLLYLNEVWHVSIMCFSNVPYWSINYEMWYYALFAVITFTRGRRRLALLAAGTAVAGPKILLLAPVWALGVMLYRWQRLRGLGAGWGLALWLASAAGIVLFQHWDVSERGNELLRAWLGQPLHKQLAFSRYVLGDYLLGLLVAAHFAGARAVGSTLARVLAPVARPVRWLAGHTFALYLMHQPLLLFFAAVIHGDPRGHLFYAEVMSATLLTVWMGSAATERWRGPMRRWLLAVLQAGGRRKTAPRRLPPAVVLGIDTPIGLAIVRALGRHGVAVTGIARSAAAPGLASRYLRRGLLRAPGEEGTLAQLEQLRGQLGSACLFAISENDISMLNRHRDRLHGYRLLFPQERQMRQVLDKNQTYAIARDIGLAFPLSVQPGCAAGWRDAVAALRYPVVLKWADPERVRDALSRAGLACEKLRYCHSAAELLDSLQAYDAVGCYPLVQEYCPGYGLGQFLLMRDGEPLCAFQHRRVHEWPPEGGASTQCVSVALGEHRELMRQSIALLRALRWDGVAMVEYRYDPASGNAMLMEINGRFWGSLPLACHAGVEFPWLLYRAHVLGRPVRQPHYAGGLRCRFMIPETRRLLRLLLRPDLVADRQFRLGRGMALWHYLRDCLRPRMRYFVFDWADPAPLWHDLAHALLRRRRAG